MRAAILIAMMTAAVLASGCSSVPLSTMWKMRGFDESYLAAVDPNQLRLQIEQEADFALRPGTPRMTVALTERTGQVHTYEFPLEIVERREWTQGWLRKQRLAETTLRLTPEAAQDFVRFQADIADSPRRRYSQAHFGASSSLDLIEGDNRTAHWTVRMRFDADQDYLTLIDSYKLTLPDPNQPTPK